MVSHGQCAIAIDIGAGLGVKIGLFDDPYHQIAMKVLKRSMFKDNYEDFVKRLVEVLAELLTECGLEMNQACGIGIASPGLFDADGGYLLSVNLPFLNKHNLKNTMQKMTGLPVAIDNDANVGGVAEWSVMRTELFYWVFGGGWGGAWINKQGIVQHPAVNWDGVDSHLHFTNEPGYAIPLAKLSLKPLFYQFGASYERFEKIICEDMKIAEEDLTGPDGDPDSIRAEVILSGPGRCRLFRTLVGDDDFYERFLDMKEAKQMSDPSVAGQFISKLSQMRVESAVNTDRLFGRVLAMASHVMIKQARLDGLEDGVPICLGGKPSYALPYFGPSAQSRLGSEGIMSYMRPSIIDERGLNANLVGAAVLAERVGSESVATVE